MLGWMILFALMTLLGAISTFAHPAVVPAAVSLTFGFLLAISLVARLIRGRGV